MGPTVRVLRGDLTQTRADALVNPANSFGTMGGGVALALKQAGGVIIEAGAVAQARIPVGSAIATSAGTLPAKWVIHAPTMNAPVERIDSLNVRLATLAALACAEEIGARTVAFPGMGTGVGGVSPDDAAGAMVSEIFAFEGKKVEEVILVGYSDALTAAFTRAIKKLSSQNRMPSGP